MSECEHCEVDFYDDFRNGHHCTPLTYECTLTGEPCAAYDDWSICPKGDDDH